MSKEVLILVDVLAREKNLDKEIVFQCLEKALALATKKSFINETPEIDINIDRLTGKYKTIRKWVITSDVDFYDDDKELSLSDIHANKDKYGFAAIGDIIEEEIENIDLSRVSAQAARNIITQRIKDAEREQLFHEYLSRNYGIVIGKVKKIEHGNIVVDCGRIEAIIMKNDLIPLEIFKLGDQIKGYLDKKNLIIRSGRMVISRIHNDFLRKLLENNVPEITTKRIEVVNIARIPGARAKVSVFTNDAKIDAKGACIGFRNQRIESVSKELFNEKIDIIDFDNDLVKYTINALSPAEIISIIVNEEKKCIDVIVDDSKLAVAIGENGANVRLASQLVGMNISIFGQTDAVIKYDIEKHDLIAMFATNLDIDDDVATILVDNDFTNLEEVAYVNIKDLTSIDDFDEDIAHELQTRARNKLITKTLTHKNDMDNLANAINNIVKFSNNILLQLVEANIKQLSDIAELSVDELMDIITIDSGTANTLIFKSREACGYFNE